MVTRGAIVVAARSLIGTPYHHQASCKDAGCDCLGLIRGVWREVYGPEPEAMPPYTRDWGNATGSETLLKAACRHLVKLGDVSAAEAGDVLVFRMRDGGVAKHAGILVERSRLVHAQEGLGVVEIDMGRWWRRRAVGSGISIATVMSVDPVAWTPWLQVATLTVGFITGLASLALVVMKLVQQRRAMRSG